MHNNDVCQFRNLGKWFLKPFPYYRIPQALFDPCYDGLSPEAKLIYGILLSRTMLSYRNGWEENGECFSFLTIEEVKRFLGCSHDKATKLFRELEQYKLLQRKRQGLGKPARIVLLDFVQHREEGINVNAEESRFGEQNNRSIDCEKTAIK